MLLLSVIKFTITLSITAVQEHIHQWVYLTVSSLKVSHSHWLVHWGRILVQVTIYRGLRIGRDDHLDQSEAHDIS